MTTRCRYQHQLWIYFIHKCVKYLLHVHIHSSTGERKSIHWFVRCAVMAGIQCAFAKHFSYNYFVENMSERSDASVWHNRRKGKTPQNMFIRAELCYFTWDVITLVIHSTMEWRKRRQKTYTHTYTSTNSIKLAIFLFFTLLLSHLFFFICFFFLYFSSTMFIQWLGTISYE